MTDTERPKGNKMNEPQETQLKPEAGQPLAPTVGSAPTRDPRDYVCAGARRLAMRKSEWLKDWWISYSPRNDNQNAEGTWEEWVSLASAILKADAEWKAQNARLERAAVADTLEDIVRCENCGGSGIISYNQNLNPNSFDGNATAKCTRCGGTGIDDTANANLSGGD